MIYLLDTNAVADYLNGIEPTVSRIKRALLVESVIYLSQPVDFEVVRGLLKIKSIRKLSVFEDEFAPQLDWLGLTDADWRQAAHFWVDAVSRGKQLSDMDLLLAALAVRVNGVIISDDGDFDALPVKRENWRISP